VNERKENARERPKSTKGKVAFHGSLMIALTERRNLPSDRLEESRRKRRMKTNTTRKNAERYFQRLGVFGGCHQGDQQTGKEGFSDEDKEGGNDPFKKFKREEKRECGAKGPDVEYERTTVAVG